MFFWLNGDYRQEHAAVDINDRGFLLGDGVFETLLVEKGAPAFLAAHLARLDDGLSALRIEADLPNNFDDIILRLAEKNGIAQETAAARITISRGASGRGLVFPDRRDERPTVLVSIVPFKNNEPGEPTRLIISNFHRSAASITSQYKTTNYLDNILARNEAARAGADDAVMVNEHGNVACTSAANLFVIDENGMITTPPAEEGALCGIVRGLLLREAGGAGAIIREAPLTIENLRRGVVFVTNSLVGLRFASMVDVDRSPTRLQTKIFNQLRTWYQSRLHSDLTESASNQ